MKLASLYESKMDQVNKTIQTELWPLVHQLDVTLPGGKVIQRPDKDGAVLRAMQNKANAIIDMYMDVSRASPHHRQVDQAQSYQQVLGLMTNVLMKSTGLGVVKPE